ncbi:hypothetical protein lerEdw1_020612 [Lerista edwardsae]|nr:hypothetical protein lerEdw1_020612 [Lerista edwardsae]
MAKVEISYLVAVPAILYHPNVDKVCLLLSSLTETVHIEVTLETQLQNHTLVEKDVDKPGIYECIDFKEEEVARVHVLIRKGDTVSFEGRKKVLIREAYTRKIIETDKPFYKPGETVKFRIVMLNEKFQAIDDTDPNTNRIGQWVDVRPQQGIVDLSFPLASEAPLGTYKIKVGEKEEYEEYWMPGSFSVEEYELPKFEVLFKLPSLVTAESKEFQVEVCGKYTYGKPVHGNVNLEVKRRVSYLYQGSGNETLPDIEKEYTGQTAKTGCAMFTIKGSDMNLTHKSYDSDIRLVAELEEEGTGVKNWEMDSVSVLTSKVSLSFVNLNPFYKLGVPYAGQLKATVYGLPVKNFTVYLTVDVDDKETHTRYVTDEEGIVHFSLDTANWNNTLVSIRGRQSLDYGNQTGDSQSIMFRFEAFNWLKPFYSESNSFLEIQHVEGELPCETDQEVLVDYILDRNELEPGANHVVFYYLVVSKGKIVSSGQKEVPVGNDEALKGRFSLTLSTSFEMAPTARLLLYAVFADGEVAADVEEFAIEKCFKHKVVADFAESTWPCAFQFLTPEKAVLPGSKVNLKLEAAPGALCSLQAVDKSVLLKEDKTLTPEQVYRTSFFYADDTIAGRGFVYHLEDFEPYPCLLPRGKKQKRSLKVAPWYQSEADVYSLFKLLRLKILTNSDIKKPVSCEPVHERLRFTSFQSNGENDTALSVLLLESKLAHGSAQPFPVVHQAVPFVSQTEEKPKKEEKAKPRTHFPESWIWDLVPVECHFCILLWVEMHRNAGRVRIELAKSQQLEVKACPTCQYTACLCKDEAKTFSWNVTATELGEVGGVEQGNVEVDASSFCNGMLALVQIWLVVVIHPFKKQTPLLCSYQCPVHLFAEEYSGDVSKEDYSEGFVEEETHNVFLCSSGDPAVEDVSLQLPEAFVKDSARATVTAIDKLLLLLALIPADEKGGVDEDLSLTAYIAASLLELKLESDLSKPSAGSSVSESRRKREEKAGDPLVKDTVINSALLCLKRNLSSADGAYIRALLAYVFTLAGDTETRQQLLEELDKEANKKEGFRSFSDIETTAYYLLAFISTPEVSAEDLKHGSEIARALISRRNALGGFHSTQNTVVALQALSRYAALTYREIESLTALVTSSQGFRHEFHVDKQNRLVLQQASLPNVPGQYKVEVSGSGCVYLQGILRYNRLPQEDKEKVFALEVETTPKECNQTSQKHFDITLQVSYIGPRQTSNMALIEVTLLSGFIPVKTSVKRLQNEPRVKKVEFDPDKINIYLDWLDKSVQSYSLSVQQEVEVTDLKPAIVKLYDYYHPASIENCETVVLIYPTKSYNLNLLQ